MSTPKYSDVEIPISGNDGNAFDSGHVRNTEALRAIRAMEPARSGKISGKIAAIKLYRMITGATLKDSKEAVEDWVEGWTGSAGEETSAPTVRVRIAVAVDQESDWNATGWSGADDDAAMGDAVDTVGSGEARYWVTVDLPIPQAVEVAGNVEPAEETQD